MNTTGRKDQKTGSASGILLASAKKFMQIDGSAWAEAFAFNAFFSLFPVMVLIVTIASFFIDRARAGKEVITFIEGYVPITGEMQRLVFDTIAGVITARGTASAVALLVLIWAALQCFTTLICATNRAWGSEAHNWWRLPMKSLVLLGITTGVVLLGLAVPMLVKIVKDLFFPVNDFRSWVYDLGSLAIPWLMAFLGISLFYRLAPRRPTLFAEVWVAALLATALLQSAASLFVIYLRTLATLNAVYGAFGGIMALLLWIYLSGCIFIFGACLCAAQVEERVAREESTGTAAKMRVHRPGKKSGNAFRHTQKAVLKGGA